jgi:hypothetical protein
MKRAENYRKKTPQAAGQNDRQRPKARDPREEFACGSSDRVRYKVRRLTGKTAEA